MNRMTMIMFSILMLSTCVCHAQENILNKNIKRIKYIAGGLAISEEKARDVVAAMDYNEEKLQRAIKDTVLNLMDKQQLIGSLLIGRRSKINSLLTTNQQAALNELFRSSREKSQRFIEGGKRKSVQQLNGSRSILEKKEVKSN